MNPYEELGVAVDATLDQIKAAHRRKSKTCHPDKFPNDESKNEVCGSF